MKESLEIIERKISELSGRLRSNEMQREYLLGGLEQLKTLSFTIKNEYINKKNTDFTNANTNANVYKSIKDIHNYDSFIQQNC